MLVLVLCRSILPQDFPPFSVATALAILDCIGGKTLYCFTAAPSPQLYRRPSAPVPKLEMYIPRTKTRKQAQPVILALTNIRPFFFAVVQGLYVFRNFQFSPQNHEINSNTNSYTSTMLNKYRHSSPWRRHRVTSQPWPPW